MVNSAKASLPPLQPPSKPPAMTPPLPGLPPMQPPSDLTTFAEGLFCTLLEVTSSFTPDNSRLEPPTYLKKKKKERRKTCPTLVSVYYALYALYATPCTEEYARLKMAATSPSLLTSCAGMTHVENFLSQNCNIFSVLSIFKCNLKGKINNKFITS